MWSFWETDSFIGKPDVTIIGSGIVGLSAAIEMKRKAPQLDVLVVERGELPSGASTKNAGFACFGSPSEILMDLETNSEELVFSTMKKRLDGLNNLRNLLGDKGIGYEEPGSYELFLDSSVDTYERCMDAIHSLNSKAKKWIGIEPYKVASEVSSKSGFNRVIGAIQTRGEGQIDTGRMMQSLINLASRCGVRILNGLSVSDISDNGKEVVIDTPNGTFNSDKVLIATNGFAAQLILELDVQPARAQVLITKPISELKFKGTYHFDCGYYYFRNVGDRVLFGGGRNLDFETETTSEMTLNNKIQSKLDELLKTVILPKTPYEVEQRWSGIMGVGTNKAPYVKLISSNVGCSVKLGGMGVAIGSLTGKEGAQLILES